MTPSLKNVFKFLSNFRNPIAAIKSFVKFNKFYPIFQNEHVNDEPLRFVKAAKF
jgi:hypothetical protein